MTHRPSILNTRWLACALHQLPVVPSGVAWCDVDTLNRRPIGDGTWRGDSRGPGAYFDAANPDLSEQAKYLRTLPRGSIYILNIEAHQGADFRMWHEQGDADIARRGLNHVRTLLAQLRRERPDCFGGFYQAPIYTYTAAQTPDAFNGTPYTWADRERDWTARMRLMHSELAGLLDFACIQLTPHEGLTVAGSRAIVGRTMRLARRIDPSLPVVGLTEMKYRTGAQGWIHTDDFADFLDGWRAEGLDRLVLFGSHEITIHDHVRIAQAQQRFA